MLSIILLSAAFSTNVLRANALGEERQSRIVQTAQGPVKGYTDPHYGIYTFYGIPYATAPKGVDRYKAPLPGPSWITPFNAVTENIFCPQYKTYVMTQLPIYFMTEDCLVANVYVPNTTEKNLPVMVVIHGGAFQIGSGTVLQPKTLVRDHNIIVVTFNYRLGVNGFLCLGTEAAPGNAGLKDQLALLRWVNKNIASFGGNPDDVTLSGHSAGSVATNLHMVSTLSKGLFNKVISESGSNVAGWSVQTDPLESAKLLVQRLNVTNTADVCALEKFYTTASIETITSISFLFEKDCSFYFSPCLETDVGQKDIFLTDSPYNILKSGQFGNVPLLVGISSGDGLLMSPVFDIWKNDMNENFSAYLPQGLQFENKEEKEKVANTVKHFYFGDKKVGDGTMLKIVDYFTDVMFLYPIVKEVQFYVNGGLKVFLFEYNYVDELTPAIPHTFVKKPVHTAETFAVNDPTRLLTPNLTDYNLPEDNKKHRMLMRQIWSNFIKTGVPIPESSSLLSVPLVNVSPLISLLNFPRPSKLVQVLDGSSLPSWPPVGARASPHMSLGREVELRGPLLEKRVRFWEDIYQKHRRLPEKLSTTSCGKDLKFHE